MGPEPPWTRLYVLLLGGKNKLAMGYLILLLAAYLGSGHFETVQTFAAPEAKQAVATDGQFVYVIDDAQVAKYAMDGEKTAIWQAEGNSHIKHLNSGFIMDGKLYMAHSNYPALPRVSTIEVLDTKTLQHIETLELGEADGAANVVLWQNGYWWIVFAHYSGPKAEPGKTTANTRLDKYDSDWNKVASYSLPNELVAKLEPKSISGADFGPDGLLYCTGHDLPEVYQMAIPEKGNTLVLNATYPVVCEGQGIAWWGNKLYTIKRHSREVVVSLWHE